MVRHFSHFWLLLVLVGGTYFPARAESGKGKLSEGPLVDSCAISFARLEGQRFTNGELIQAVFALQNHSSLDTLSAKMKKDLGRLAAIKAVEKLNSPDVLLRILLKFRERLGKEKFQKLVGETVGPHARAADLGILSPYALDRFVEAAEQVEQEDARDMSRGFGFQLLRSNDKAFDDPDYVARLLAARKAVAPGYPHDPTSSLNAFHNAWAKLSPKTTVIDLSITGSDAINNLFPHLLDDARRKYPKANDVELLVFQGSYVGMKGRAADLHHASFDGTLYPGMVARFKPKRSVPVVESPYTVYRNPPPDEVARLLPIEDRTLADIEARIKNARKSKPVGGILIEPILGAAGVLFYRPEFLLRLRALCDQYHVPIVADEILTGGGRTGRFFAYEHVPGFEPDLVTFGKGLVVAGIARVDRSSSATRRFPSSLSFSFKGYGTTVWGQPETLLKSAQIMKRIHDDNLMANAESMGGYMLSRMKPLPEDVPFEQPRGVGLLIYDYNSQVDAYDAQSRLMPYLDITKEEFDKLLISDR